MASAVSPELVIRFPLKVTRPATLRVQFRTARGSAGTCRRRSAFDTPNGGGYGAAFGEQPPRATRPASVRRGGRRRPRGMRHSREGRPRAEVRTPRGRHRRRLGWRDGGEVRPAQDPWIEVILLEPIARSSGPPSAIWSSRVETIDTITLGYDGLRPTGSRSSREPPPPSARDQRVRIGEGYLEYDRLVVAPGVDFLWTRSRGRRQDRLGPPRVEGRPADRRARPPAPGSAGRRRGAHDGARRPLPMPSGPLRACLPDRLVPRDKKPQAKLVVSTRTTTSSPRPPSSRRPSGTTRTSTTVPPARSSGSTSRRAKSSRPSVTACGTTSST